MKCQYCNSSYPVKHKKCPSCGASRAHADPEPGDAKKQVQQNTRTAASAAGRTKGAKVVHSARTLFAFVGVFVVGMMILAVIINKVEEAQWAKRREENRTDYVDPASAPYSVVILPGTTRHELGEAATLDNVEYTLLSVVESRGTQRNAPQPGNTFVLCEFEVFNNTNEDIYIYSSEVQAYVDEYAVESSYDATSALEYNMLFRGDVAAGRRMKGFVGFELAEDWATLELLFKSSDYRNVEKLVFTVQREDIGNAKVEVE